MQIIIICLLISITIQLGRISKYIKSLGELFCEIEEAKLQNQNENIEDV